MEKYEVAAIHLIDKTKIRLTIDADEGETSDDIILTTCIDKNVISASSTGYFGAFQILRDKLLAQGIGLTCVGSRLNAVQSGMASYTNKVYVVTLGKPAAMKDLTSLYNYDDITEFPNTKEQNAFHQEWIMSLRERR